MNRFHRTISVFLLAALAGGALPALADQAQGVVNINNASAEQLAFLPRIGPAVASRIVEHRKQSGPFKTLEDLMLVRGIGERTFDLLKPYLTLSGETTLSQKVRTPRRSAPKQAAKSDAEGSANR